MGRVSEEPQSSPQPTQDQYNHNYDQAQETPVDTYYTTENDQPAEVTNIYYEAPSSENTPQPPPPPQYAPPPPPQPVQFPPPSPQPQPQAYPLHQGQPQAYPPSYGQKPQAYYPQQGQPQAYGVQQGQPQPYPPQQYGQPQGYQTPNKPAPPTGFPMPQPAGTDDWSSDLFDCMDDPENAIITACFPCVTYGQIAEIVDNGHSSCTTSGFLYGLVAVLIGCPCILSCSLRTKLRSRYGLSESPAPDWITHCFCEWCALCQEYRELNSRGLDPAIGWQGNVLKQQNIQMQQATMAPPVNQRMM